MTGRQPRRPGSRRASGPGRQAAPAAPAEVLQRRWLVFGIVSIGLFMASIDQTIVATALPAIEHDLHAGINWSGWTITIYALGQVIAMPMAGKISDMYGRKKVFAVSAAVFTLASLCCGFAPNMALLLVPRFIQALGGGAFMPSATGIVADHFGPERDRAVGLFTSILPVGGIIGPIVGGVFVSYWSWRGIFLVNVPIGIALIALTVKFIPSSSARKQSRIDLRGIILLAAADRDGDVRDQLPRQRRSSRSTARSSSAPRRSPWSRCARSSGTRGATPAPFVPYRLLRGRGFGIMNLINLVYGAAALGFSRPGPALRAGSVPHRPARRGHAADRPRGWHDRRRRGGGDGPAADRLPATDDHRLRRAGRRPA